MHPQTAHIPQVDSKKREASIRETSDDGLVCLQVHKSFRFGQKTVV